MLEQINFAEENCTMTFNSPHFPILMLQSVFTKLPNVLPANVFNIDWRERGDSESCDDLG